MLGFKNVSTVHKLMVWVMEFVCTFKITFGQVENVRFKLALHFSLASHFFRLSVLFQKIISRTICFCVLLTVNFLQHCTIFIMK